MGPRYALMGTTCTGGRPHARTARCCPVVPLFGSPCKKAPKGLLRNPMSGAPAPTHFYWGQILPLLTKAPVLVL